MITHEDFQEISLERFEEYVNGCLKEIREYDALERSVHEALAIREDRGSESQGKGYEQSTMIDFVNDSNLSFSGFEDEESLEDQYERIEDERDQEKRDEDDSDDEERDKDITSQSIAAVLDTCLPLIPSDIATKKEENHEICASLKQMKDLNAERTTEMANLAAFREHEMKKLHRERANRERQKRAFEIIPNRKEREEASLLSKEIDALKQDAKVKDKRAAASQERLKKIIEDLVIRNGELVEEIKVLEMDRTRYLKEARDGREKIMQTKAKGKENTVISKVFSRVIESKIPLKSPSIQRTPLKKLIPLKQPSHSSPTISQPALSLSKRKLQELESLLGLGIFIKVRIQTANSTLKELYSNAKIQRLYICGTKLESYDTGVTKQITADGNITLRFLNGDTKQIFSNHEIYFFSEQQIRTTTLSDGTRIDAFQDGQIVEKFVDGRSRVEFPDRTVKITNVDGREEIIYPNGKVENR